MRLQDPASRYATSRSVVRAIFALALAALLPASEAAAQSTDDINASLQFNFTNPGARSLGVGGAFIARADDATAVYANPAGLIQLSRPELSLDLRRWQLSNVFLDRGFQESEGSFAGLEFAETDDTFHDVSFLSGFYPARSGRWVAGLSVHRLARFETEVHSEGSRVCCTVSGATLLVRPIDGFYNLDVENVGVSGALRLSRNFSLGATLSHASFDLTSRTERLDALRPLAEEPVLPGIREGDPDVCCQLGSSQHAVIFFETQTDEGADDEDVTFNIGMMWQSSRMMEGTPLLTVGGVYRRGPEFGFVGNSFVRFLTNPYTYQSTVQDPGDPEECRRAGSNGCPGVFKVPDVLGLGVSFRPAADWVVALDYNRIEYSDLTDAMLDIVGVDSALGQGELGRPADFRLEDGNEFRLGAEYALVRERRHPDLFFRGGVWYDPDHKLRYVGSRPSRRAVWAPGSDELHYSAGIGLRYPSIQLDAAVDLSDQINTFSLSTVVFIGRR